MREPHSQSVLRALLRETRNKEPRQPEIDNGHSTPSWASHVTTHNPGLCSPRLCLSTVCHLHGFSPPLSESKSWKYLEASSPPISLAGLVQEEEEGKRKREKRTTEKRGRRRRGKGSRGRGRRSSSYQGVSGSDHMQRDLALCSVRFSCSNPPT